MTLAEKRNKKWLKAAIIGCLWASSEIVLGSFLHNMRIPFSSNFLTALGIILLISINHLWKENGLFWRAGLICALMKTMSPSAIIFGPMIAIFSQALLMELAIFIFRRNMLGYIIGGLLAMSWNLFHKIANLILIYGFDVLEIYTNLTKFAEKQLDFQFSNLWTPVAVLWIFYLLFGLSAAIAGIAIGKKSIKHRYEIKGVEKQRMIEIQSKKEAVSFNYSLVWFGFNILGMVAVLFLMNFSSWIWWIFAGIVILSIWALRYHRALKPLQKPKFWILFILITMLSSFFFTQFQQSSNQIYHGLIAGLQMNFRAAIVIVGFSTIGTELYNPAIRTFLTKTTFKQLPSALEAAFDTLPFVVANLPSIKEFIKRPAIVFQQFISQIDFWLDKLIIRYKDKQSIIILTGNIGEGKSQLLSKLIDYYKNNNIITGGILSPALRNNNDCAGYDLIDINTNEKTILARTKANNDNINVGRFFFLKSGIEFGKQALSVEKMKHCQLIFIDEIGPWELENQGWAAEINKLLIETNIPMIWVVRSSILEKVIANWNLNNEWVFDIAQYDFQTIIKKINETIFLIE